MKLLGTIWTELIGLFVDDWGFAAGVLLWVGLLAVPSWHQHGAWEGIEFFAGLAVLTLAFVTQAARR